MYRDQCVRGEVLPCRNVAVQINNFIFLDTIKHHSLDGYCHFGWYISVMVTVWSRGAQLDGFSHT